MISISTSAVGIAAQPLLYSSFMALPSILQALMGGTLGLFIFVNPFAFHWMTKRYITSLYYERNRQVFTAETLSFFLRKKTRKFQAEDVHVPDIPGVFTTFTVDNRPFLIDPGMFLNLEVYKKLMGFDKPLDLSDFINQRKEEKQ